MHRLAALSLLLAAKLVQAAPDPVGMPYAPEPRLYPEPMLYAHPPPPTPDQSVIAMDESLLAVGTDTESYTTTHTYDDGSLECIRCGAVRVYRYEDTGSVGYAWRLIAHLTVDSVEDYSVDIDIRFGTSVALSQGRLLVGSPKRTGGSVRAYLFDLRHATAQAPLGLDAELVPHTVLSSPLGLLSSAGHGFGRAVAMAYPYVAIGAPWARYGEIAYGAVAIGKIDERGNRVVWESLRYGWPGTDHDHGSHYGAALAMAVRPLPLAPGQHEYTVLVGAPSYPVPSSSGNWSTFDGRAQLLSSAVDWSPVQTFDPPDVGSDGWFGRSVANDGNRIAIGESGSSRVLLYRANHGLGSFVLTQELSPSSVFSPDEWSQGYGWAVALKGDHLLVGAPFARVASIDYAGVVYGYVRDAGTGQWLSRKPWRPSPVAQVQFGKSVGLGLCTAAVAEPSNYEFVDENNTGVYGTVRPYVCRD